MIGIASIGSYIPKYRIATEDIARVWGKNSQEIISSLGVKEKSVAGVDEDAASMAIEAASQSLLGFGGKAADLEALFVGSESHPYAVNPTATIIGEFLGIGHNYLAADMQFACKAGSAGIQALAGLVAASQIKAGMAIGTDVAQSRPHDALEYASASAAVAVIVGSDKDFPIMASLEGYTSYSSDTPDFWRRDGIRYPSHAGRFTGEPAYFAHVEGSSRLLMKKMSISPKNITHCVFHMPNGKFPRQVAKRLGFTPEQLEYSLTVDFIGNPYSASSLLGLAAVLEKAKAGDIVFMASYGSGAGSDAFLWKVLKNTNLKAKKTVMEQINHKTYISYTEYLKKTHKI